MSVLHLRSTSEPWTLVDGTDDAKLVFDNVNTNFIMDYERFLKNYEKQNPFLFDHPQNSSPAKTSHLYSPSRSLMRADTTCGVNPHASRKLISQRSAPMLQNGNAAITNGVCRSDSQGTIKSSKSMGYDYGKENRNRKYRQQNERQRLYVNYPIISPPPGFEDDIVLLNDGNVDANMYDRIDDEYPPSAASFRAVKYRLQKDNSPAKNVESYYPKDIIYGHCREQLLNGSGYKNGIDADCKGALYNNNNRKNQLINSYNSVGTGAQRSSSSYKIPEEYSSPSNNVERQRKRIIIKSSPEYYYGNYNEHVDRSKWRSPASMVPRRSFSTGNTTQRYYDECNCYRCGVPSAPSFPPAEIAFSPKNDFKSFENESGLLPTRFIPEQRIRRSASFQTSRSNYASLPPDLNGYGAGTLRQRNHSRIKRPPCTTFDNMGRCVFFFNI